MARSFKRPERLAALSAIDVTPLLDLAFSLLIIFMISTPLLEQTIQVDLPIEQAKQQTPRPEQRYERIGLDAQGQIFWGDQLVSEAQLNELLAAAAAGSEQPVISFRADRSLTYQQVVSIIDMIKQHNLTKLNLETQAR